ncbi:amino acid adenylation domain-containing protein [Micromonospora sp. NPDC003197]
MTGDTWVLPTSSTQRRLWLLDQLTPGSPEYNIAWSVRLTGPLRHDALEAAWSWLVDRHEALRTTFTAVDGEPAQRIQEPGPVRLTVTDLAELSTADRGQRLTELVETTGRAPFDLATGPLLRLQLIRLAADEHLLVVVVHHIVADGWSFNTVFAELGHAYQAAVDGIEPSLPPPPIQYADFAVWQGEQAASGALAEDLEFWRAELAGAPTLLDLPADRHRPPEQTPAGGLATFDLPAELTTGVRALARQADTTTFAVLLSGFQALLHRLSGQDDLLVGVPVSGRTRPETQEVVGFFANTLALRARFDPGSTYAEVLRTARASAVAAQSRQDVPFERVVDLLAPTRSLAYSPVVQVMFALDELPAPTTVAGLRIVPELHENGTVKFDLTLTVEQRPEGLRGRLTYRTDLFDADRIRRFADQYLALLGAAVAAPDTPVAELALLSPAQRQETLRRWRSSPRSVPPDNSVPELLDRHPPADPDAVAVVAPDGAQLTYRELTAASNRLAHLLREHGVGPDVPVGLCLSRGTHLVTAILAVWKAGGGYLPLDPELPTERLAAMAAEVTPPVLVSDLASAAGTTGAWAAGTRIVRLDDPTDVADLARRPETAPEGTGHPASLAYLLYTSGSTGTPKAVVVTHGSVVNLLTAVDRQLCLTPADRMASVTTPAFDISVVELILPLLAGARVELIDARTAVDATALRAELAARQVTAAQATPATWRMLVAAGGVPAGVRTRISGGEALTRDLADALRTDGATVVNGYGPSETTIYSTIGQVGAAGPVDLGGPVDNTGIYLLDPAGNPVGMDAVGEVYLGGLGVGRGYHGRSGLTATRFRPDPYTGWPGARMYATGDLARWLPTGRLEYLGRADHQIKLRGYRIEPGEIEAALREQPQIRDAVVTTWRVNADDVRLVGYVVPAEPGTQPARLWPPVRAALARRLPEYMLPATLVVLDELPRTGSGKVDRRALPEPSWSDGGTEHTAARTPVEERLAALWCEVLGRTEVGVHDNFFALGGHSLTATRLIARIRTAFGVDLPLRLLFAAPTIAELGELVDAPAAGPTRPAEPARDSTASPDRIAATKRIASPDRVASPDRIAAGRPSPEDLLASLDDLSDGEIDELLNTLIAEEGA